MKKLKNSALNSPPFISRFAELSKMIVTASNAFIDISEGDISILSLFKLLKGHANTHLAQ